MKSSSTVPIAIIVGGLIIAGAIYILIPNGESTSPSLVRPVATSDHILGNPAAPIMIVEYSDFDCEYCKAFHDTLHQIVANEGAKGQVAWVFRHFPLTELVGHEDALALAKASECAAQAGNDTFWRFIDALYKSQPVSPSELGAIASLAKIPDTSAFATCYASESASAPLVERIMADRENALQMGAGGTPYSIILTNGKDPIEMVGAYSYDAIRSLISPQ